MSSLNTCAFTGRLTKDAGVSDKLIYFTLAIDTGFGEHKAPLFLPCKVFSEKKGDFAKQYLIKGTQIGVTGEMRPSKYTKDNVTREFVELVVSPNAITLLGGKSDGNGGGTSSKPSGGRPAASASDMEDDIPWS